MSLATGIMSVGWLYDDGDDDGDDDDGDVMMMFPVGYTTADVVYQWTAGRGVNIASDMKLSQV